MKRIMTAIILTLLSVWVSAQDYQALRFRSAASFFNYEMMEVHQHNRARAETFNRAVATKEEMETYISGLRARFRRLLGALPVRGKMKSSVVDTKKGRGFYVEKIIFCSAPGRYVTAHLYLPEEHRGRVPACIEMCGHGQNGKGCGSMIAERMAVNGIAVMVVDPLGQGERQQLIDVYGKNLTRGVTTEHTLLAPMYLLLGSSLAAQEYFDNSRAIDYLLTRKDIDGSKIGCYGFSGGGTQTAYLIGLDERIQVGCVGLFFSSRERTLESQGPSDGCQWMPCEGKEHIEIADMGMMMASKPFLVMDGLYDFVDHWGALQGFDEVKQCYTVLGHSEKVEQYYFEDGHAVPTDAQEKMVTWFRRWLLDDMSPLKPLEYWQDDNMLCTKSGQVNLEYRNAQSSMQACMDEMNSLADAREDFCRQDLQTIQRRMKIILGLPDTFNDRIETVQTGCRMLRTATEYRYQVNCKGEYPLPVIVRIPSDIRADSPIVIHLTDRGKAAWLAENDRMDAWSNGSITIAADLRGFGETADLYQYNLSKYWNSQYRTAVVALHVGRPLLGQRVMDIRTLLNFCGQQPILSGHPICIEADGISAVAVMHATILDERIHAAILTKTLKTWRTYIEYPLQQNMMSNTLVGVLRYYDIPDLVKISRKRINICD